MQKIYLDGKFVDEPEAKVSVFDHAVLYGDGIFEGIRAYNGRVFRLDDHINRFFDAANAISLELPLSKEEIAQVVVDSCKINDVHDGYIRLVATRGKGDLGLSPTKCPKPSIFCIAGSISLYPQEMYDNGLPVITAVQRRNNSTVVDPQIKSLNYLNNILAKMEANRAGAQEALMLTRDGIVAECTGDNIFIIKNGVIYTPPIHIGTLDGITRRVVMEQAKELGFELYEKEFTLFNVYNADEFFLTGTAAEVIACTSLDGKKIGTGVCGPITRKLLEAFQKYAATPESGTEIFK